MTDEERKEWDPKLRRIDVKIADPTAETAKSPRKTRFSPVVIAAIELGFVSPVISTLPAPLARSN